MISCTFIAFGLIMVGFMCCAAFLGSIEKHNMLKYRSLHVAISFWAFMVLGFMFFVLPIICAIYLYTGLFALFPLGFLCIIYAIFLSETLGN